MSIRPRAKQLNAPTVKYTVNTQVFHPTVGQSLFEPEPVDQQGFINSSISGDVAGLSEPLPATLISTHSTYSNLQVNDTFTIAFTGSSTNLLASGNPITFTLGTNYGETVNNTFIVRPHDIVKCINETVGGIQLGIAPADLTPEGVIRVRSVDQNGIAVGSSFGITVAGSKGSIIFSTLTATGVDAHKGMILKSYDGLGSDVHPFFVNGGPVTVKPSVIYRISQTDEFPPTYSAPEVTDQTIIGKANYQANALSFNWYQQAQFTDCSSAEARLTGLAGKTLSITFTDHRSGMSDNFDVTFSAANTLQAVVNEINTHFHTTWEGKANVVFANPGPYKFNDEDLTVTVDGTAHVINLGSSLLTATNIKNMINGAFSNTTTAALEIGYVKILGNSLVSVSASSDSVCSILGFSPGTYGAWNIAKCENEKITLSLPSSFYSISLDGDAKAIIFESYTNPAPSNQLMPVGWPDVDAGINLLIPEYLELSDVPENLDAQVESKLNFGSRDPSDFPMRMGANGAYQTVTLDAAGKIPSKFLPSAAGSSITVSNIDSPDESIPLNIGIAVASVINIGRPTKQINIKSDLSTMSDTTTTLNGTILLNGVVMVGGVLTSTNTINANGTINSNKNLVASNDAITTVPLAVSAMVGTTASLQSWKKNNTELVNIDSLGALNITDIKSYGSGNLNVGQSTNIINVGNVTIDQSQTTKKIDIAVTPSIKWSLFANNSSFEVNDPNSLTLLYLGGSFRTDPSGDTVYVDTLRSNTAYLSALESKSVGFPSTKGSLSITSGTTYVYPVNINTNYGNSSVVIGKRGSSFSIPNEYDLGKLSVNYKYMDVGDSDHNTPNARLEVFGNTIIHNGLWVRKRIDNNDSALTITRLNTDTSSITSWRKADDDGITNGTTLASVLNDGSILSPSFSSSGPKIAKIGYIGRDGFGYVVNPDSSPGWEDGFRIGHTYDGSNLIAYAGATGYIYMTNPSDSDSNFALRPQFYYLNNTLVNDEDYAFSSLCFSRRQLGEVLISNAANSLFAAQNCDPNNARYYYCASVRVGSVGTYAVSYSITGNIGYQGPDFYPQVYSEGCVIGIGVVCGNSATNVIGFYPISRNQEGVHTYSGTTVIDLNGISNNGVVVQNNLPIYITIAAATRTAFSDSVYAYVYDFSLTVQSV